MIYFFDTEFEDNGKTIELISIGVAEISGRTFYAEAAEYNREVAPEWLKQNVIPHLNGPVYPREEIARRLKTFMYLPTEIWGYFPSYDWVVLCQLFGTMMDLPKQWPMRPDDVRQLANQLQIGRLPEQTSVEHHALNDAVWTMKAYLWLKQMYR